MALVTSWVLTSLMYPVILDFKLITMIQNNRQYRVTSNWVTRFSSSMESLEHTPIIHKNVHPLLIQAEIDGTKCIIKRLTRELHEYETQIREDQLISCPGDTLLETLGHSGILKYPEFADYIDMSRDDLDQVILGYLPITRNIANKLMLGTGIKAQFWINREAAYRWKLQEALST